MSSWEYSQPAAFVGIKITRECWPGRIYDSSFCSSCIVQQPIMRGMRRACPPREPFSTANSLGTPDVTIS
jgi:hypothetical protein